MKESDFEAAVEAVDNAFQLADASVEVALNAMGYLTSLTISEFPEDEQEEVLESVINSIRKNVEMMSNRVKGRTLQ
jgi:uncharacterized protein with GYD domain